ncbi:hypothetical protein POVCU2_0014030 [Plasmodium ovale curtisi]|uniref:PIR Superfamily Protein n=1 Tax=Plasmodium ovale curtisi TaxID=864141 RepID=A0A1A8VTI6_PLAOA|nr:hypothetical protein POVCU2_0014030 [Plasmodium ovale curtisi]
MLNDAEEVLIHCDPGSICVPEDFVNTSINFSDYRIMPLIILSVWAVFLSVFFIYKLTPFGSRLKNILQGTYIIRKDTENEEMKELFE